MNELDFPISAKEVTEATKKLKKGKSSGSDSILNEMLKYGNFVLQPCLVKLFNIILSSGIYPTEWIQGLIFPIYQTGDPLNPSNYRGIAITRCLSKVFWMPDLKNIFSKMNLYVMNKLASKQDAEHPTTYLSWKLLLINI